MMKSNTLIKFQGAFAHEQLTSTYTSKKLTCRVGGFPNNVTLSAWVIYDVLIDSTILS